MSYCYDHGTILALMKKSTSLSSFEKPDIGFFLGGLLVRSKSIF